MIRVLQQYKGNWVAHAGILFPVNSHAEWQALPKV